MLRVADFGIQSLQMRDLESTPSQRSDIFTNIETIHTVQDTEGNTSSYTLNMAEESDGTNRYFKLIGIVKEVRDEGTPDVYKRQPYGQRKLPAGCGI